MVSVIVPVHNGEKTLRKCVDAILRSTITDMEIILVENCLLYTSDAADEL